MSDEKKFAHTLAKRRAEFSQLTANFGLAAWKAEAENLRQRVLDLREESFDIAPADNRSDLDSAVGRILWFPLTAALLLNRNQQYAAAHEWYRLLYDPETNSVAEILQFFTGDVTYERSGTTWLDEPFDPVAIANRREGVWLRHTVLAMVRNLIDWADDEFARGLPDTYLRAEELYELARRTLQAPPLRSECEEVLLDVVAVIGDGLGYTSAIAYKMARPLHDVTDVALVKKANKDIHKALSGRGSLKQKQLAVERIVARTRQHPDRSLAAEYSRHHTFAVDIENAIFFKPAPDGGPGGPGGRPFEPPPSGPAPGSVFPPGGRPFDEPIVVFEPLEPVLDPTPPPSARPFCVPPNPVLRSLQLQIDTQLYKLRHCLDFMGEPQIARVYGCDTYDAATGLINRPTATLDQYSYTVDQPRYRYSFLIEKARQYVDVAQRIGAILLQALQNSDNEAFAQLKARHAIELADATTELRRLGRLEAEDGVEIAGVQKDRAGSQVTFWSDRVGDPDDLYDDLSVKEAQSLQFLDDSVRASEMNSIVIGAATVAASLFPGGQVAIPVMIASFAAMASAQAAAAQARASFERRAEEWANQLTLAHFDSRIADIQVTLADDRLRIAGQELEIASLQLSHAREELRFLQDKTTNLALYDWMVRVLSRDYRSLMQIAACVARMAQRALEFERQETVRIVTGDYWNIAQGALASSALTDEQRSLGLLGAERLLTDLTKLDAFKLATEKRRLQISKTFSLARMMPTEMVEFRDSGRITFNTLLDWFDDGFQGHYLRLIKSVRVSILALVPPLDGIHAMLHNTGESSVVVLEDGTFSVKRAARNFGESIALDSAFNESGLFVLNYEDPMLLPFEGLGVQTQWTLELPRGNNRFNFDSIADVFLTIEYTAEYSREYEQQMRAERTGEDVYEDAAIPLRVMFPDLWYHLKNHRPDAAGTFASFQFKFAASRRLFAPNLFLTPPAVEHLTMLASGDFALPADPASIDPEVQQRIENGLTIKKGSVTLHAPLTKAFGPGVADSNSLMLSTRGAGAGTAGLPTVSIADRTIGASDEWILEFAPEFFSPVTASPKPLIERIADVLLVITVKGNRAG